MQIIRHYSLTFLMCIAITWIGFSNFKISILWVDDDDPTCGGFSPCYPTIQEAVAAAQPGDIIKIRPGIYQGPITINKNLTLSGESQESVTIKGTEDTRELAAIKIIGLAIVKIEKIALLDSLIGIIIEDSHIQLIITDSKIFNNFAGIMGNTEHLTVLGSEISNNSIVGINIGINMKGSARIEGNQFLNNGTAIIVGGQGSAAINKNQIAGNKEGVKILDATKVTLSANRLQKNSGGIMVYKSAQAQLQENQIMDNDFYGVAVGDFARVSLVRNRISNNGWAGELSFLPSFFYIDPFRNTPFGVITPKGFGVIIGGRASVELVENHIERNVCGLGATPALAPDNQLRTPSLTVERNLFRDNVWGVWLRKAEASLSHNEILENGLEDPPPQITSSPFWVLFEFPTSGVLVQGGQPLLQSNHLLKNYEGIVLQNHASPTLIGNEIRESIRYGIALYQGPCYEKLILELQFEGKIQGEANELVNNKKGDLCPADYPWPPGFRK